MSQSESAVLDTPLMPYEGREMSVEDAAKSLLKSDSPEEPPVESEAPEVEETDLDESEEVEVDPESDDEESDTTPDDGNQEPDDPHAEREKQRQADYTRKTQALAEERRAFEAERAEVQAERARYAEVVAKLEAELTRFQPVEPDWEKLRAENPGEYAAQREDWRRQQEDLAALRAENERLAADRSREEAEQLTAYVEDQKAKLLEAIPEWQDSAKAKAEKEALFQGGSDAYGFTEDDFANVLDHRLVLMLRDALKYRELATKGKETIESSKEKQKVLQPGSRDLNPGKTNHKAEVRRLENKLKSSGSEEAAVALLLARSKR